MKEQIESCIKTWKETLRHFQVIRSVIAAEEIQIARAVQRYGYEFTELALFGARFEAKTDKFDPADYISATRVLSEDRIQKFSNLGSRKRFHAGVRKEVLTVKQQLEKEAEERAEHADPQKVRELISRIRG